MRTYLVLIPQEFQNSKVKKLLIGQAKWFTLSAVMLLSNWKILHNKSRLGTFFTPAGRYRPRFVFERSKTFFVQSKNPGI